LATGNGYGFYHRLRHGTDKIDMQQTVIKPCPFHFYTLRDDKCTLELPCRDAPVEENAALPVVSLAAANYQLVIFQGNLQVVHGEAGYGEGNAERNRTKLLNIVWRVAIGRVFRGAFDHLLQMVEAQEKRRGEDTCGHSLMAPPC